MGLWMLLINLKQPLLVTRKEMSKTNILCYKHVVKECKPSIASPYV